jgi:hypothetical protein
MQDAQDVIREGSRITSHESSGMAGAIGGEQFGEPIHAENEDQPGCGQAI